MHHNFHLQQDKGKAQAAGMQATALVLRSIEVSAPFRRQRCCTDAISKFGMFVMTSEIEIVNAGLCMPWPLQEKMVVGPYIFRLLYG